MNVEKVQKIDPEDFKNITIFTDGGSRGNPGPSAGACVVKDSAGKVRLMCGKYLGKTNNNIAEYQGVVLAFEEILKLPGIKFSDSNLKFNLDSMLVVNQLNGKFKVKDDMEYVLLLTYGHSAQINNTKCVCLFILINDHNGKKNNGANIIKYFERF